MSKSPDFAGISRRLLFHCGRREVEDELACLRKPIIGYGPWARDTEGVAEDWLMKYGDADSAIADCRMIWGGDRTITDIKTLSSKPRCVDVVFADRYSVAIINGKAIHEADKLKMARLAQDFYNDTYLMDQNACSSPQIILWENDSQEVRKKFWDAVYEVAEKQYVLQDSVSVDKYTLFCDESVVNENIRAVTRRGNLLHRIELKSLSGDIVLHRGNAGFFFEYALLNRKELFAVITEKFQTITQFGIDPEQLAEEIATEHVRGVDRIVPIGQAMNIGVIWDGYNLIYELSRIVIC